MSKIVQLNPGIKPREIKPAHIAAARKSLKNDGIEIFDDGSFKSVGKAYGGRAKKKMMGGGKVHKKMYAMGGGIRKAKTYG